MINKYLQKLIKEIKITKVLLRSRSASNGMTYVELIVVLSIFSLLSSVAIYNYGDFQANVDIKNLGSDIGLKIVEAQKSSLSGILPPISFIYNPTTWKPSYGIYFDIATQNQFIYFVDINNFNGYEPGEELETIIITKNNYISKIESYNGASPTLITSPFSITFKRPNSSAVFTGSNGLPLPSFDYMLITISSPKGVTSLIRIYPSGRIQAN